MIVPTATPAGMLFLKALLLKRGQLSYRFGQLKQISGTGCYGKLVLPPWLVTVDVSL